MSCHILPNVVGPCAHCIEQTPHGILGVLFMENKTFKKGGNDNKTAANTHEKPGIKPTAKVIPVAQKPAPKGGAKPSGSSR